MKVFKVGNVVIFRRGISCPIYRTKGSKVNLIFGFDGNKIVIIVEVRYTFLLTISSVKIVIVSNKAIQDNRIEG